MLESKNRNDARGLRIDKLRDRFIINYYKPCARRLPSVYDVPGQRLVEALAEVIEKDHPQVSPPSWSLLAKTAPFKSRPPSDPKWWYKRAASVLRFLYLKGPIGVSRLRSRYGGRKDTPMRKAHHKKAGGSAIRKILKQLELENLVVTSGKGRAITPKGRSLLDSIASNMLKGESKA